MLLLVLFFLCVVSQATIIVAQVNMAIFIVWAVFVVFPVVLLALLVRGIQTHAGTSRKAWREWQRQMQKWQALYYCHRCGGVFLPGILFFVPVAAAQVFLAQP